MQNAPIIDVSAAERGCGKLKKGGLYLGASMSASGSLLTLVPLLPAAEFEVAPRKMILMSTAELAGQMALYDYTIPSIPIPHSQVLVSHVGKRFYTPFSFMQELKDRGPSRRISPQDLPDISAFPIPIIFTHDEAQILNKDGGMPKWLMDSAAVPGILDYVQSWKDFHYTWDTPGFGWDIEADTIMMLHHPMFHIYKHLVELKEQRKYTRFLREHQVYLEPGIFCGSWITHAFWVPTDDGADMPDELLEKGVYQANLVD